MKFKAGDNVSFLNEALNCIVIDVIDDSMVLLDCQGVEIVVSADELILINDIPEINTKDILHKNKTDQSIGDANERSFPSEKYPKLFVGDHVTFMQDSSKGVIINIFNNTEYEVEIESGFSVRVSREEIEKIWEDTIDIDLKKINRIIRDDSKKETQIFSKKNKQSSNFFNANEIDLHIENIVDYPYNLSNHEIITFQINAFKKRLLFALKENEESFIVIHGIGKGILKEVILKHISDFKYISMIPADSKIYGMGASEIRIKYS